MPMAQKSKRKDPGRMRLPKVIVMPNIREILNLMNEAQRTGMLMELPWMPDNEPPLLLTVKYEERDKPNFFIYSTDGSNSELLFNQVGCDAGRILDALKEALQDAKARKRELEAARKPEPKVNAEEWKPDYVPKEDFGTEDYFSMKPAQILDPLPKPSPDSEWAITPDPEPEPQPSAYLQGGYALEPMPAQPAPGYVQQPYPQQPYPAQAYPPPGYPQQPYPTPYPPQGYPQQQWQQPYPQQWQQPYPQQWQQPYPQQPYQQQPYAPATGYMPEVQSLPEQWVHAPQQPLIQPNPEATDAPAPWYLKKDSSAPDLVYEPTPATDLAKSATPADKQEAAPAPKPAPKPKPVPVEPPPPPDEYALGDLLVVAGIIPVPALQAALTLQNTPVDAAAKPKIGDILVKTGVPGRTIQAALTLQKLARKGRVTKAKVGNILQQAHKTGRSVEEILELEWAQRAKTNPGSNAPLDVDRQSDAVLEKEGKVTEEERKKVTEVLETIKRLLAEDQQERAKGTVDILTKAGIVKPEAVADVYKNGEVTSVELAKKLLIAEAVDVVTFEAAFNAQPLIVNEKMKEGQAIIALLYCQRSRVPLADAIRDLSYDVELPE